MIDSYDRFEVGRATVEAGPYTPFLTLTGKTTTTASFVVPAKGGTVTIAVVSSAWTVAGEYVNVIFAGLFEVISVPPGGVSLELKYRDIEMNGHAGETIPIGVQVVPGSFVDTTIPAPSLWYELSGITTNGNTVPFNRALINRPATGTGTLVWVSTFGNLQLGDTMYCVAIEDSTGNIVAAGSSSNSIYIRKYSPNGILLWELIPNTSGVGTGVCIDASGNIYIVGYFTGPLIIPGLVTKDGNDALNCPFVLKLGSDGGALWSVAFPTTTPAVSSFGRAIALSGTSLWITGDANGDIDFGGGVTSAPPNSVFIVKLKVSDGTYDGYGQRFGGNAESSTDSGGKSIVVDSSGNIIVGGSFDLSINFGGGAMTAPRGANGFIVKFDSSMVWQWNKNIGDLTLGDVVVIADSCFGVAAVPTSNDIYAVGEFKGTVDFGNDVVMVGSLASGNTHDGFLVKYNSGGVAQWGKHITGQFREKCLGVATNASGAVAVGGQGACPMTFPGAPAVANGNFSDAFVVKYESDGTFVFSKAFGSYSQDFAYAVVLDSSLADANVVVAGSFYAFFGAVVDFGDGINRTSSTGGDAYLAKYSA